MFFSEDTQGSKKEWVDVVDKQGDNLFNTWFKVSTIKNQTKENIANINTKNQLTNNQKVIIVGSVLIVVIIVSLILTKKS